MLVHQKAKPRQFSIWISVIDVSLGLPEYIEISIYLLTLLSQHIIVNVLSISILLGAQFLQALS